MEKNKISNLIFSPSKFFEGNEEKSSFVIPMLLQIIATVILVLVSVPIAMESQEVAAVLTEETKGIASTVAMVSGAIGGAIGSVISLLISSLVLFLCVRYILKGNTGYKNILSVYSFALLPQVVLNLIYAVIYKVTGNVSTGVLPELLSKVNPLTIWSLVLTIIGIHVVGKVSMKKSSILCIVLMAISVGTGFVGLLFK